MYFKLLFAENIAVKQLINRYLTSSFSVCTNHREITRIEGKKVPLYQGGYNQKILYISGVAMGRSKSQNSLAVAGAIALHLSQNSDNLFRVNVVPPGWIHIELVDSTLAAWLQNLIVVKKSGNLLNNVFLQQSPSSLNSLRIFTIQYAHSRCCSLLRLGYQEGLIAWGETIPWLNSDQKLRLNHPDESFLIHQLVKVVDDLVCADGNNSINWETVGWNLSQAFEKFWCSCRIWGEVKIHDPELAQARLGLLIVTQLVLKSVLEDELGIVAPEEL
ncbi:anticodon-binding protein [Anabaena sp. UHCC 0253]|uniref:DALR anticodon-binding domain-containing protein n=1 Tax=Anabaena sp. UHCC 0253 TaxID=2590019 RepID=UPI00144821D7|nr:anticodon-binding protein [Anabaena sp. UHCC 0253]